jgi:hypothetical protein
MATAPKQAKNRTSNKAIGANLEGRFGWKIGLLGKLSLSLP